MTMLRWLACALLVTSPTATTSGETRASEWRHLSRGSTVIILGSVVSEPLSVERPDRRIISAVRDESGNTIYRLPPIGSYVVGLVQRLRVDEVVKGGPGLGAGNVVELFTPGVNVVSLRVGDTYLCFLVRGAFVPGQGDTPQEALLGGTVLRGVGSTDDVAFDYARAFSYAFVHMGSQASAAVRREPGDDGRVQEILEEVEATLDRIPPTMNLLLPGDGSQVSGALRIEGTASDDHDVESVEIRVNGRPVAELSPADGSFATELPTNDLSPGAHDVLVIARDVAGNPVTSRVSVVVPQPNRPPAVSLSGPDTCSSPCTITLTAVASDPDGDDLAYTWEGCAVGSGASATCALSGTGEYTATVTVADGRGGSASASKTVIAPSIPPTVLTGGPYLAGAGQPVRFEATASAATGRAIISYEWSFGDGGTGTGNPITHVYAAPGTYATVVTVRDDQGEAASANATVTVLTAVPVVWKNVVNAVATGSTVQNTTGDNWNAGAVSKQVVLSGDSFVEFTAAETDRYRMAGLGHSDPNPYWTNLDFAFYLIPGGGLLIFEPGSIVSVGSYSTGDRLRVSVDGGQVRYWKNGTVVLTSGRTAQFPLGFDTSLATPGASISDALIAGTFPPNQPPVAATGGPYSGAAAQELHFDGSASVDPDGDIVSYDWDFGDGTIGTGPVVTHAYATGGTYPVTLTVRDGSGAVGLATTTAAVLIVQDVVWVNVVNASASGNDLQNISGDNWNAGALSQQSIPAGSGFVEFTATETNRYRMAGLGHGDPDPYYTNLDFAFYLIPDGGLLIFEPGSITWVGSYSTGDRLRISVDGGQVRYWKNGAVVFTSGRTAQYPLRFDASLATPGASISDAVISYGQAP